MKTEETWRKASYSNTKSACVELFVSETEARVRDSKNREADHLSFTPRAFTSFLDAVKAGQHDLI